MLTRQAQPHSPDVDDDELIPDPQVRRLLGNISEMTTWRWDRDPKVAPKMAALGWPPPIYINQRKYRSSRGFRKFKEECVRQTIAQREKAA